MEAKKIAIACFIGGAICSAVALMFAPFFWWLGLIAGMAGGYISYEFREFITAIPIAFHRARSVGVRAGNTLWHDGKQWLLRPHPFILLSTVAVLPVFPLVFDFKGSMELFALRAYYMIYVYLMMLIMFTQLALIPVTILAFIGARYGEKCYWWPFLIRGDEELERHKAMELETKGYTCLPVTYGNVLRWTAKGLGLTVLFFVWTLWKYLGIGIGKLLGFLTRFVWHVFKRVHSSKRILCALDGTLGGAVTFLWLAHYAATLYEQATVVVFGGLIGAVLGVVHWKIADKYLPKANEVA